MKFQLLPSTFEENGSASARQHLTCFVVDDCVAIDAGSLAMASDTRQKKQIRNVVLTHAHLDHIAGLPLFVDDLFTDLAEPIQIHATSEIIEILERDIFNWEIYPRFSELKNKSGKVLVYVPVELGNEFPVAHLRFKAVNVNHKVPAVGFVVTDGEVTVAMSGDTAEMSEFWQIINAEENLSVILIECAFPDDLEGLAHDSHHLTPKTLQKEIGKLHNENCLIYAINLKPMFREKIIKQIGELRINNLEVLEVGKIYEW